MPNPATRTEVTQQDAEQVLTVLLEQLGCRADMTAEEKADWHSAYGAGPQLIEKWDWLGHGEDNVAAWSVVWEEGPYEWSWRFPHGGVDPEMAAYREEFNSPDLGVTRDVSDKLPAHLSCESMTSWATAICLEHRN